MLKINSNRENCGHITSGRVGYTGTRIISSNTCVNGESGNWRFDYHKFKGHMFAYIFKNAIKNSSQVQESSSSSRCHLLSHKVVKQNVQNASIQNQVGLNAPAKVSTRFETNALLDVSDSSSQKIKDGGGICLGDGVRVSTLPKLSPVSTCNRYEVLQQDDAVVSFHSNSTWAKTPSDLNLINNQDLRSSKNTANNPDSHNASLSDASVKNNTCAPPKVGVTGRNNKTTCTALDTQSASEYDLPLRFRDKKLDYTNRMASCPTLQLWDKQNAHKFGFIPLGDLDVPPTSSPVDVNTDPLTLHKTIKASGKYNFKECQINVKSQLNPDVWDSLLLGYWDSQLPFLIRFGFPLDFDRQCTLESHSDNHTSAKNYPQDVQAYLNEEIQYNAILGPFDEPPLDDLHTSPFMTREKSNSANRRVIIDLSFPQGRSVNAGSAKDIYLGTPFALKLPTIDHITNRVRKLGRCCMIYKIDIKRAFRHVKLDRKDYDLLGLRQDKWFLDTCLLFGFRHGSALFQHLSDAVHHMMHQRGHDVINYIDDILGIELRSRVDASFDALSSLLERLGFEISQNKLIRPSTCVNCLGILVNTENFTLSVPPQKLQEILLTCQAWCRKTTCTKRQLQSLLGSLLFISKCVRSPRFFLNRLLDVLRSMHDKDQGVLSQEAQRDINWFQKFLLTFNGITIFDHRPIAHEIELDACLQGLGARWGSQVFAFPLPLGYLNYNIAHLEMLNILVVLRVWQNFWAKTRVRIACDNEAVVQVLGSGHTRDLTLAAIARNIQLQVATWDINLQVIHIPGKDNQIADLLSRWNLTENPQSKLLHLLPHHQWVPVQEDHLKNDWCI